MTGIFDGYLAAENVYLNRPDFVKPPDLVGKFNLSRFNRIT